MTWVFRRYAPSSRRTVWDTHGNFCFSAAHDNGTVTDNTLLHTIMPKLVPDVAEEGGAPATLPKQAAAVRRLFYESHVLYVGQLRAAVEKTDDEPSVRMHHLEREDRKDSIRDRLAPGLIVDGKA